MFAYERGNGIHTAITNTHLFSSLFHFQVKEKKYETVSSQSKLFESTLKIITASSMMVSAANGTGRDSEQVQARIGGRHTSLVNGGSEFRNPF